MRILTSIHTALISMFFLNACVASESAIMCDSKDDMENGCYTHMYYESGGIKSKSHYEHGKLNGISYEYYETGEIMSEKTYVDGVLSGRALIFYKNGQVKNIGYNYKGALNGLVYEHYSNGRLKSILKYYKGTLDSIKIYKKDGNIIAYAQFENGLLKEFSSFYPSFAMHANIKAIADSFNIVIYNLLGQEVYNQTLKLKDTKLNTLFELIRGIDKKELHQTITKCNNEDDKFTKDCVEELFSKDGVLLQATQYKNGMPNGKSLVYDLKGNLFSEEQYKDGRLEGLSLYYAEDGRVKMSLLYEDNLVIEGKCIEGRVLDVKDLKLLNNVFDPHICDKEKTK